MNIVLGYIVSGVIVMSIYTIVVQHKTTGLPIKEILIDWIDPVVFVLFWPIDLIWGIIRFVKEPNEFKEGMCESLDKYHP